MSGLDGARAFRVLVFLPTYNESGNIRRLIDELLALPCRPDVLVVDDQSPDGTGDIVQRLAESDSRVHLVSRPSPRGRGLAGRDGFAWFQRHPEYDVLVEMDADFSHQPKFIPALVEPVRDRDVDVVVGSRFAPGGGEVGRPASRQWISKLANTYLRFVLMTRLGDCTSGFRAFGRRAFAGVDFGAYRSQGPTIVTETLFDMIRRQRRLTEVPILFEERAWGDSKLSWKILVRSLFFPLSMRWERLRMRGVSLRPR